MKTTCQKNKKKNTDGKQKTYEKKIDGKKTD